MAGLFHLLALGGTKSIAYCVIKCLETEDIESGYKNGIFYFILIVRTYLSKLEISATRITHDALESLDFKVFIMISALVRFSNFHSFRDIFENVPTQFL